MYQIENDYLKVSCKAEGAELTSLFNKHTRLEYLWQAEKEWPKHAPVLFPIVGQLKNNSYHYQGNEYKMERHGFARIKNFSVSTVEKNEIEFLLKHDNETLKVYPFEFVLKIKYTLEDAKLIIENKVENAGRHEMYFSIGAHPAFRVPLHKHEKYDNYHLEFNRFENASCAVLENGLISNRVKLLIENDNILPLTKSLFYDDALVFKHLESTRISIISKKQENGLHFNFEGFPYFGIWAAKDADFVCLEPWQGIADSVTYNGQLENKEGIIKLNAGKTVAYNYSIQPF